MLRVAALLIASAALGACTPPPETPGTRGHTLPRHIKPDSYTRREIPRTPMTTQHVLEVDDDCGNRCDFLQNAQSFLTLHLQDKGLARAEDHGELIERVTSTIETTAQQTTWNRTWVGTWDEGNNGVNVVLKPEAVECKRITKDGDTDHECSESRELRLRCHMVSLDIVRPRNTSARAWACRARGPSDATAITPLPWVFGISEALVVLDGGNSHEPTRRYALQQPKSPVTPQRAPATGQ